MAWEGGGAFPPTESVQCAMRNYFWAPSNAARKQGSQHLKRLKFGHYLYFSFYFILLKQLFY